MAINVPLNAQLQNATQLQQQIQNAVNSVRLNIGGAGGARALNSLSQPLGRLTGQADEFTKSLDAANARVLAFGASVGVVNALSNAFKQLVVATIDVEKTLADINVIFGKSGSEIKNFGKGIFDVAKQTGQSFQAVSKAALEFARQGLGVEDTLKRTNDALVLTRLTGLDTEKAVAGLTATINGFAKEALTTAQVVNSLAAVDQKFAVSAADLIDALNRSAGVAENAGVGFNELVGIVTALQERTARGGAVIGNAIKTIFTRIQRPEVLAQLQGLGVAVEDFNTGKLLSASEILKNLAGNVQALGEIQRAGVFEDVAGGFQINQLIALLNDLSGARSKAAEATKISTEATNQAYVANEQLNKTISALVNQTVEGLRELGATLGNLGLSDNIKSLLGVVNGFIDDVQTLFEGEGIGSKFAAGIVKGLGSVLSGPGLALFGVIISKLLIDLGKFAVQGLKTFLGIGKAAADQKALQDSIVQTLLRNEGAQRAILSLQGNQIAQASVLAGIFNQQQAALTNIQRTAAGIAPTLFQAGLRGGPQGLRQTGRAAGGYLPAAEASDVRRGVGGAPSNAQVVSIPNFAFGGGKRGTMIANTSEYIVPNFAGGGSAIFNQDMVRSMGLPKGAKKIRAAGGYIPNFAGRELTFDAVNDLGGIGMITLDPNNATPSGYSAGSLKRADQEVKTNNRLSKFFEESGIEKISMTNLQVSSALPGLKMKQDAENQLNLKKDFGEKINALLLDPFIKLSQEIFGDKLSAFFAGMGPDFSEKLKATLRNNQQSFLSPSAEGDLFERAIKLGLNAAQGAEKVAKVLNDDPNSPFDYSPKGPIGDEAREAFFKGKPIFKADAKRRNGSGDKRSMLKKVLTDDETQQKFFNKFGTKFRDKADGPVKEFPNKNPLMGAVTAANGYIPNFAASALQEAIAREQAQSGLQPNQISVTRDPRLVNAGNPNGLAVVNNRDEPNGRVPNFARTLPPRDARGRFARANAGGANNGNQEPEVAKGIGDLAAKFIVLQGALTFFEGGFTDAGSAVQKVSQALQTLTSAFFAYQAIQQITTKAEVQQATQTVQSTSKLKIFTDKIKKFADDFAKGGGARASLVSRGGRLPSGTPFATRLSAGLGTSRAAQGVRNIVANPLSVLKSIGAAAAAGAIALKSFNDLAGLFYTRSSKLDSSLELLSSSAGKAAASLSDVDKASLKGATSGLKSIGAGAAFVKFLDDFNPFKLGKETVAYNSGGSATISRLRGGQTQEDFAKVQEDLSSLIFSDLKTQYKDAPKEYLKTQTQSQVASLFATATENGVLDLEKLINLPEIQKLVENASDTATKIDRITVEAESKKPFAKLLVSVEEIIANTNTAFNNEINRINDFSERIKAVQASKAFSNLSFEQQFSTNLLASTKEFENSFRQRQIDIIKNAQELIKSNLPQIVEGEEFDIGQKLQTRLQGASNLDQVSGILTEFQEALKKIDPGKTRNFVSQLNDFQNSIATFNSNLQTRSATLKIEQEELIATTKAQIEFRDKFIEFSNSIGEAQRSLIGFRGQLERVDIETESRINQRSAFATSRQEQLNIRREETLSGLSQKQRIESSANLQEALIEARKQSFTQENLVALNFNTQAIKDLTSELLKEQGTDFRAKYNETEKIIQNLTNKLMGGGKTSDESRKEALGFKVNGSSLNLGEQLNYYQNALNLTAQNQPNIQASNVSAIAERVFASNGPIRNIAQSATSLQEFIDKTTKTFELNDQTALLLRPQLLNIYDSIKGQAATAAEAQLTEKARLDAAQKLLDATNNYKQSISNTALDLKTRLDTEPMSRGQFAAAQRQYFIAKREEKMSDEQIREYRSSFSRGFEEALGPLEEKTLDFKNELGREIPQLFSQNLAQGLNDAISGAKSLKDALTDAATSFFQAITQKNIENLANVFTGAIFSPLSGGGNRGGGFASGGMIKGGSGTKDDVPAMLMGGEYVVKKSAVKKYGSAFFDSLNNGKIQKFAKGGSVGRTQSGAGGFYTPGDFGTGSISGSQNLLDFATQSRTSGQFDTFGATAGGASINLEPESVRLSTLGRENSPIFERVQQSKEEAFNVYKEGIARDKQYKDLLKEIDEREKARKKQLITSITMAVASTALNAGLSSFAAGASNAVGAAKAANSSLGFGGRLMAGLKGGFGFGGMTGQGGLGNLFSGNFGSAFTNIGAMTPKGTNPYQFSPTGQYRGATVGNTTILAPNYFRRASGGYVMGGSGLRDDIPTMLTGGEFVLNNRATKNIGLQKLNQLNTTGSTETQSNNNSSELMNALIAKFDELIQVSGQNSSKDNVVVNVSGADQSKSEEEATSNNKELQKKIKQAVLDVLAQEKRLGGSLGNYNKI